MRTTLVVERAFRDCVELGGDADDTPSLYLWRNSEVSVERVLEAVESGRWADLAEISGFFAGVYRAGGRVHLFCDRLGVYPLFYRIEGQAVHVAPVIGSIRDAASTAPSPCKEGVVSLLLFGHHLANETVYETIKRCNGGHTVVIGSDGRIAQTILWKKEHRYNEKPMITVDQLGELCVSAVRNAVDDATNVLVGLSGGFDSRAVLGGLMECVDVERIRAITFGGPDTSDFKIGKCVSDAAGIQHTAFPILDNYFDDAFLRQRSTDYSHTYSAFATQPARMIRFLSEQEGTYDASLWGVGGDAISGSHLHDGDDNLPPCVDSAARAKLLTSRLYIPVAVVSEIVGIEPGEIEAMVAVLLERSGLPAYDESWQFLDAWDIFVRGRMELIGVLPFDTESWRCPHLSGEYFEQMASLCFSQKLHQAAYKEMLAHRFAALFSLPTKRLQGRSLVSDKGLTRSEFALRAARARGLLLRAINLAPDSVDRNYAKDRVFFRSSTGRDRLQYYAAILREQEVVSCSADRLVALAENHVQVARMAGTIAYAFGTCGDTADDLRQDLQPCLQ